MPPPPFHIPSKQRQQLLQNVFVYSAVCSSCKSKRRKLELWQDNYKCVRLVQGGLSSLRKLCGILNLPRFLTNKNYDKILKYLAKENIEETEIVMKNSAENL